MEYFANVIFSENVYLVFFPEFPNVNTYGENLKEALYNASEALNVCLESDFERGYLLPEFNNHSGGNFHRITVKPHIELAYTLKNIRENKSQVEIARLLGISYQAYQKLENPRKCNPTIKTLEKIGNVLGKKLQIRFA